MGSQRHALGMITRGGGDHPSLQSLCGEIDDLVIGTAQFEREDGLQILPLQKDFITQALGQQARVV